MKCRSFITCVTWYPSNILLIFFYVLGRIYLPSIRKQDHFDLKFSQIFSLVFIIQGRKIIFSRATNTQQEHLFFSNVDHQLRCPKVTKNWEIWYVHLALSKGNLSFLDQHISFTHDCYCFFFRTIERPIGILPYLFPFCRKTHLRLFLNSIKNR